jgi:hypothetical protein
MLRRLLNIASIVCLVLCVALMGMWVRSYYWIDSFTFNPWGSYALGGSSVLGRILFGSASAQGGPKTKVFTFSQDAAANWDTFLKSIDSRFSGVTGFGLYHNGFDLVIMVPYWFAILLAGALAFAPWSRVKYRFGLHTLFVLTTFLAVVLGMIAWLDRAWVGN